jgi:hypothetical protein
MNLLPMQVGWLKQCACIGVGAGAGPLWAAQGVYIGAAAAAHVAQAASSVATAAAAAGAPLDVSLSAAASALNARFYSIFMLSGFSSNAVASIIMLTVPEPALAVRILFAFLTIAASAGVLGMFLIESASAPGSNIFRRLSDISAAGTRESEASRGGDAGATEAANTSPRAVDAGAVELESPQKAHALTVLCLVRNDSRLWLLLPAAFAQGSSAGFFMGTWLALAVSAELGAAYVGIAGAVFAGGAVLSSRLWARLASLNNWGRRWSFVVATILAILWCAITALSWRASSRIAAPPNPTLSRVAQALIFVVVLSITDPVFSAFLPATIQTFFSSRVDLAAGVAATKVAYCIGFAVQQVTSLSFFYFFGSAELAAQALIICLLYCAAGAALLWLHFKIPHGDLDTMQTKSNPPG